MKKLYVVVRNSNEIGHYIEIIDGMEQAASDTLQRVSGFKSQSTPSTKSRILKAIGHNKNAIHYFKTYISGITAEMSGLDTSIEEDRITHDSLAAQRDNAIEIVAHEVAPTLLKFTLNDLEELKTYAATELNNCSRIEDTSEKQSYEFALFADQVMDLAKAFSEKSKEFEGKENEEELQIEEFDKIADVVFSLMEAQNYKNYNSHDHSNPFDDTQYTDILAFIAEYAKIDMAKAMFARTVSSVETLQSQFKNQDAALDYCRDLIEDALGTSVNCDDKTAKKVLDRCTKMIDSFSDGAPGI